MNDTELSKIVNSLLDRPIAFMTDQQLSRWLKACEVMERKVMPFKARRNWTENRVDAEAERRRREAVNAELANAR